MATHEAEVSTEGANSMMAKIATQTGRMSKARSLKSVYHRETPIFNLVFLYADYPVRDAVRAALTRNEK